MPHIPRFREPHVPEPHAPWFRRTIRARPGATAAQRSSVVTSLSSN